MSIDKGGIIAPDCLGIEFFRKTLENGLREDFLKVYNVKLSMGSSGGDNYCSVIYRALVVYGTNEKPHATISLIVKSMPITEHNGFLITFKALLREKVIYWDILPKMEILLKNIKLGAKCYNVINEPVQTIVFEDLKVTGYEMADREKGLDEEHCRMILTKLAKFHATSMVIAEREPEIMRHFPFGMINQYAIDDIAFYAVFINNLKYLTNEVVNKWPGFEFIAEKLVIVYQNIRERAIKSTARRPGEVKVLNHGDLWVNNFLFSYENNNKGPPCDVVFLDFQLSFYSSPGIDLNYFLYTSVQLDVLKNKRDQLIRTYHQTLEATLDELGYKSIPTYDDIKNELREREFYGFMASIGVFPMIAMDKNLSEDNSLENMADAGTAAKKRQLMFSSKRFTESMQYYLKRFDELGIFN